LRQNAPPAQLQRPEVAVPRAAGDPHATAGGPAPLG
jgi:hypothetical protein